MWRGNIQENILYEDSQILVCHKPAGLAVQNAKMGSMDMESALKNYLAAKSGGKNTPWLGVLHRLDQPVEGVIVFAKTSAAAANISKQMTTGGIGKIYLAVTDRKVMDKEKKLIDYLYRDGRKNMSFATEKRLRELKSGFVL
jgi:ribosomal large subunit pseudouridine synthase D (EC 5.4.99.-)